MDRVYRTDVDYEYVKDLDFDSLVAYIKDNFYDPAYPSKKGLERMAKIMSLISKYLGLSLSNEQYIFMLSNARRLLCEATAGAGKTTIAQLALFAEKIANDTPGKQMLALAYNRGARANMEEKHALFAKRINGLGIKGLHVSTELGAKTIHSFCMEWINEYSLRLGLEKNNFVLADSAYTQVMRIAISTALRKYNQGKAKPITMFEGDVQNFCKLYDYLNETLQWGAPEQWSLSSARLDLDNYSVDLIEQVFKYFKVASNAQGKYPYSEWMQLMYTLLKDKEILARVRRNYSIILVDEYQDVTPAMLRILKILVEGDSLLGLEGYPESRLICIGDNDQSIYRFRGTDPYNCMRFVDTYGEGKSTKIVSMSINRRCRKEILDKARAIIEANQERIVKPIIAFKDGGSVRVEEYSTLEHEARMAVEILKKIPRDQLENVCICYRNNSSSMYVAMHLLDRDIPFRIISGDQPFSDKLSQSIMMVLELLAYPSDKMRMKKALFRVLPKNPTFNRKALEGMIDKAPEDTKFWELPFPEIEGMEGCLAVLIMGYRAMKLRSVRIPKEGITKIDPNDPDCYRTVRSSSLMSTYVDKIIFLIEKYYFNFQNWDDREGQKLSEEYIAYIRKYFTRPITYEDFMREQNKLFKQLSGSVGGLYMSSFHSLKGLEFKHVIMIDLDDKIFPGVDFRGSSQLTAEQKGIIEAETRRLFYVACTRAIDSLTLMFSESSPCRYIRFFKEMPEVVRLYNNSVNDQDGFVAAENIQSVVYSQVDQAPEEDPFGFTMDDLVADSKKEETKPTVEISKEIQSKIEEYAEPANAGVTADELPALTWDPMEEVDGQESGEPKETGKPEGVTEGAGGQETDAFGGIELDLGTEETPGDLEFMELLPEAPSVAQMMQEAQQQDEVLTEVIGEKNMQILADRPQVRSLLGRISWTSVQKTRREAQSQQNN